MNVGGLRVGDVDSLDIEVMSVLEHRRMDSWGMEELSYPALDRHGGIGGGGGSGSV